MMSNIDGIMGRKIKTRIHPRHETQCVIEYQPNRNPAQSIRENEMTVPSVREAQVQVSSNALPNH